MLISSRVSAVVDAMSGYKDEVPAVSDTEDEVPAVPNTGDLCPAFHNLARGSCEGYQISWLRSTARKAFAKLSQTPRSKR